MINCEHVILGYIFLFSGSNSEKDESVEDSEALQSSFTNKTSERENDISVERYAKFYDTLNLYEILGVQRNASPTEIRQAYLKMSKKNYPKLQGENSYNFQFISRAYRILFNQDKRKVYDMYNDINESDNYESNNADIDYLDRFTSIQNSLMLKGLGLAYTICFFKDCNLNFDLFMCNITF